MGSLTHKHTIIVILSFFRIPNLILITLFCWVFHQKYLLDVLQMHQLEPTLTPSILGFLILDIVFVCLLGYWLNDWKDRAIDKINRPNRFLVRFPLPRMLFFGLLLSTALGTLFLTVWIAQITSNVEKMWILPVAAGFLGVYALWFKRYKPVGNIIVSALIVGILALLITAEWPVIQSLPPSIKQTLMYQSALVACILFLANWCREIVKDYEDEQGDSVHGVLSLPGILGHRLTRNVLLAQISLALALNVLLLGQLEYGFIAIATSLVSSCLLLIILYKFAFNLSTTKQSVSVLLKVFMLSGVIQIGFLTVF